MFEPIRRWMSNIRRRIIEKEAQHRVDLARRRSREFKPIRTFTDHIDSIGEIVCMTDHPEVGVYRGDVLVDPKIRYVHPRHEAFYAMVSREWERLGEIMLDIQLGSG